MDGKTPATQHRSQSPLPAPTGPYRVGRRVLHIRGEIRPDLGGEARELVVWSWYPALPPPEAPLAKYLPDGWDSAATAWGIDVQGISSHAYVDAPLQRDGAPYPTLVFSPSGFPPLMLAGLLEEIASYGYVVLGVNHTGLSGATVFPDGRTIPLDMALMQPALGPFQGEPAETFRGRAAIAALQAADIRFVLENLPGVIRSDDVLAGGLDLDRLGFFGHSLGGNAALEASRNEPKCRAVVNLDGAVWSEAGSRGIDRPLLLIMAEHPEMVLPCEPLVQAGAYPSLEWCQAERALTVSAWQRLHERSTPGATMMIRGSGHISFMDLPFLPLQPGSLVATALGSVRIDAERAWRIIADGVQAFFGRYLQVDSDLSLERLDKESPEVVGGAPRELIASLTAGESNT